MWGEGGNGGPVLRVAQQHPHLPTAVVVVFLLLLFDCRGGEVRQVSCHQA